MQRMERIAFLGLGIMGSPMAKRLLAAGYPLTVWNRTASRAEPLRAEGADVAASPAEAVRDAGVVITMLADPAAVREVIDGFARYLRPGATLIEASTIGPQALEEVSALLPGSVALVDAPVMGSADHGVTARAQSRGNQYLGDASAGPPGELGDRGFVLDLLDPGQGQRRA
jgi:3-hydroxyisobutyrate dehydrogenase